MNQSPSSILAGSFGDVADGSQLFPKITSVAGGVKVLEDSMLFSNRMSTSPAGGGGATVWKSPEELYRCNICDMKFSQMSGLQVSVLKSCSIHVYLYNPIHLCYDRLLDSLVV